MIEQRDMNAPSMGYCTSARCNLLTECIIPIQLLRVSTITSLCVQSNGKLQGVNPTSAYIDIYYVQISNGYPQSHASQYVLDIKILLFFVVDMVVGITL